MGSSTLPGVHFQLRLDIAAVADQQPARADDVVKLVVRLLGQAHQHVGLDHLGKIDRLSEMITSTACGAAARRRTVGLGLHRRQPSWSTADSARMIAAVITPWPPDPENTILHRSIYRPPMARSMILLYSAQYSGLSACFSTYEYAALDQLRILRLFLRSDGHGDLLHALHHVHGTALLVLAAEVGRALAHHLDHRKPLVKDRLRMMSAIC
jgi:hypothetical protein